MRSALLVTVALLAAGSAPAQSPGPAPQPEALTALNDAFRSAYADAKRRVLAAPGPLLIANGDKLVLLRDGRRTEANVSAPIYDPVKTIAHIPLAIFVALTPGEGTLDGERRKTLEGLRRLIPPAQGSLDRLRLVAPVLARQNEIVNRSVAFLDEVLARGQYQRAAVEAFTRRMAPLLMANVADAARGQLDALHAQVSAWRREMPAREWDQLHVVITGPHMPREDLVVTQYFCRLLHEPAEGRRIVYAESLWEEPRALDLFATHVLDGSVGEAFFGDYMRMHRDLLGDAARDYLPRLLGQ